jgi:hypothetical protein
MLRRAIERIRENKTGVENKVSGNVRVTYDSLIDGLRRFLSR